MNPDDTRDTDTTRPLPVDEPVEPVAPAQPPWTPAPSTEAGAWAEEGDDSQRRSGRHPLSIGYLVSGLIFLGVAASWGLREAGVVEAGSSSWLFPLTLVVVGAIGLAASVVSSARRP